MIAARALALRVLVEEEVTSDAQRIELAFRLCLSRQPEDAEQSKLLELLKTARAWYADNAGAARELVPGELAENVSREEAAAYAATVRVILNLDEFLTRN